MCVYLREREKAYLSPMCICDLYVYMQPMHICVYD